jgi:hypothetical protein
MLDEILESVGQEAVQVQSARSFFEDWLCAKKPDVSHNTFTRYQKVVGKFLQGLGERAEKSIASIGPRDIGTYRDRLPGESQVLQPFAHCLLASQVVMLIEQSIKFFQFRPFD